MSDPSHTLLLLEDEPVVLMDLADAAEDHGCVAHLATNVAQAMARLDSCAADIDVAILDVSLGADETCLPVAHRLDAFGIPYLLYTGDLDRHDEKVRELNAQIIAKPTACEEVVAAAIAFAGPRDGRAANTAAR